VLNNEMECKMKKEKNAVVMVLAVFVVMSMLVGCGEKGVDAGTSPNTNSGSGARVDPQLVGAWLPVNAAETADTLYISTTEYREGTKEITGNPKLGSYFYANNGQMGIENGYHRNVTYEYLLQEDTLYTEFQNLAYAEPDGVVDPEGTGVKNFLRIASE
jgi:hypothetical protein